MLFARGLRRRRIADPLRRAALVAAAAFIALAQIITAAHAASGAAFAPDHDANSCVFHMAGDRTPSTPPPSGELVILPVSVIYTPAPVADWGQPVSPVQVLPPSRGPPIV